MKKKTIIGIVIAAVIVLLLIAGASIEEKTGSSSTSNSSTSEDADTIVANAQSESDAVSDDEKKDFTEINVDTYLEYYAGSENKLVLVARPTCSYCQIAEPIIQNLAYKYDIEIYYLNTDDFSDDDSSNFVASDDTFSEGFGTPMLLLVSNNEIVDMIDGLTDTAHYTAFFQQYGYITEE